MILGWKLGVVICFCCCVVGNLGDERKKRRKRKGVEGNESDLIGAALSGPVSSTFVCCQGRGL